MKFIRKPKNKICYQTNEKIWYNFSTKKLNKNKWNFLKKNFIKKDSKSKKYLFKNRLLVKQKLKKFYGFISEYQFKNLFQITLNKYSKNITKNFLICLETRLSTVLFRLNITNTIFHSIQLINHKKIMVNNKIINSNNYVLKPGDIITILDYIPKKKKYIYKTPNYLEYNPLLKKAIFIRKPFFNEIKFPFFVNLNLLLEYYKK